MARKAIVNPDRIHPDMITKVTDMPNGTQKVVHEVAHFYNIPINEVEDIITHVGKYIKQVVTGGTMETVCLPYFGKFAPNMKLLQAKTRRKRTVHNFSQLLELAIKGKQSNFKVQTNPNAQKEIEGFIDSTDTIYPTNSDPEMDDQEENEEEL